MIDKIFKDYISEPRDSVFKDIKKYSGAISQQQALSDFEELQYIIDNRYSGKEYWEGNGISFDKCFTEIKCFVKSRNEIYISDFCRAIHGAFNVGIVDNHFSFASPLTGRLHFSKKYTAYFADIIVEKIHDRFVVIASKDNAVKPNDIVDGTKSLYPTLSPQRKEYYLIGCRLWNECNNMKISVNGQLRDILLHRCRANEKIETKDICLQQSTVNGIPVVRSNCCDYVFPINKNDDISSIGRKYSKYDKAIWNNLSNEGGYSKIPRDFLFGLNDYVCCEEYCAKLISPITENKPCKRQWILTDSAVCERDKGRYNGTLYFLMNSDTASSGETSILYAKSLKSVVFIGENSMGCNTFGNIASYQLSNSNIILRVPNMINLCKNPDDCVEGKGFTPDYWVDSVDVQSEVISWLNNPETYTPRLYIEHNKHIQDT